MSVYKNRFFYYIIIIDKRLNMKNKIMKIRDIGEFCLGIGFCVALAAIAVYSG